MHKVIVMISLWFTRKHRSIHWSCMALSPNPLITASDSDVDTYDQDKIDIGYLQDHLIQTPTYTIIIV
jgi:hypothetical protein